MVVSCSLSPAYYYSLVTASSQRLFFQHTLMFVSTVHSLSHYRKINLILYKTKHVLWLSYFASYLCFICQCIVLSGGLYKGNNCQSTHQELSPMYNAQVCFCVQLVSIQLAWNLCVCLCVCVWQCGMDVCTCMCVIEVNSLQVKIPHNLCTHTHTHPAN